MSNNPDMKRRPIITNIADHLKVAESTIFMGLVSAGTNFGSSVSSSTFSTLGVISPTDIQSIRGASDTVSQVIKMIIGIYTDVCIHRGYNPIPFILMGGYISTISVKCIFFIIICGYIPDNMVLYTFATFQYIDRIGNYSRDIPREYIHIHDKYKGSNNIGATTVQLSNSIVRSTFGRVGSCFGPCVCLFGEWYFGLGFRKFMYFIAIFPTFLSIFVIRKYLKIDIKSIPIKQLTYSKSHFNRNIYWISIMMGISLSCLFHNLPLCKYSKHIYSIGSIIMFKEMMMFIICKNVSKNLHTFINIIMGYCNMIMVYNCIWATGSIRMNNFIFLIVLSFSRWLFFASFSKIEIQWKKNYEKLSIFKLLLFPLGICMPFSIMNETSIIIKVTKNILEIHNNKSPAFIVCFSIYYMTLVMWGIGLYKLIRHVRKSTPLLIASGGAIAFNILMLISGVTRELSYTAKILYSILSISTITIPVCIYGAYPSVYILTFLKDIPQTGTIIGIYSLISCLSAASYAMIVDTCNRNNCQHIIYGIGLIFSLISFGIFSFIRWKYPDNKINNI